MRRIGGDCDTTCLIYSAKLPKQSFTKGHSHRSNLLEVFFINFSLPFSSSRTWCVLNCRLHILTYSSYCEASYKYSGHDQPRAQPLTYLMHNKALSFLNWLTLYIILVYNWYKLLWDRIQYHIHKSTTLSQAYDINTLLILSLIPLQIPLLFSSQPLSLTLPKSYPILTSYFPDLFLPNVFLGLSPI